MDKPKQPLKRKQADASASAPQSNDNGDVLSSIMATMTENDALKTRGCVDGLRLLSLIDVLCRGWEASM